MRRAMLAGHTAASERTCHDHLHLKRSGFSLPLELQPAMLRRCGHSRRRKA